jgi:hypothetical protein
MIEFKPIDKETSIEDYPGYVGMTWDTELYMSKEFNEFEKFNWKKYSELVDGLNGARFISYQFRDQKNEIKYEAFQDVGEIIDELITVESHWDDGGSYGGMASGSGYIFFLRSGYSLQDAVEELNALTISLKLDLDSIANDL